MSNLQSPLVDYLVNLKSTHNSFILDVPDQDYNFEYIEMINSAGCTTKYNSETRVLQISYTKINTYNKGVQYV
jgi:hypothetical protein